jgi:hypothetical protein
MKKGKRRSHRSKEQSHQRLIRSAPRKDYLPIVRRIEWVCALAVTAIIIFFHLYRVSKAGALWRDETITRATAMMPSFSGMWSSMRYARPPLLPYILIRAWNDIGQFAATDAGFRLLGGLTGIGILATLWFSSRLLKLQVPLLSLVLFGLNPNVILWGDSPRGYGLGGLLILGVCGLVWKVVESPTPMWVGLAAVFSIGSVQCVFHNVPLVFAICVGGFLVCLRRGVWKRGFLVLGIGAISALSLLPYVPMIRTYEGMNVLVAVNYSLRGILDGIGADLASSTDYLLWAWIICSAIGILVAIYIMVFKSKDPHYPGQVDQTTFSFTILLLGTGAYLLFLKESHLSVYSWHCIPLYAAIALSIDILMEQVSTTVARKVARLAMVLAIAGILIPAAWKQVPTRLSNFDIIAATLQRQASPGDLIVVNPWFLSSSFQYYYRGQVPWMTVPPMQPLLKSPMLRFDLMKEAMQKQDPLQPVFEAMGKSLQSGHRIWWVGEFTEPPRGQGPGSISPAPKGGAGRFMRDYQSVWSDQLGYFTVTHATEANPINVDGGQPVSSFEDVVLQNFKGWRP